MFQGACQAVYVVENGKHTYVGTCATLSICEENKAYTSLGSLWDCVGAAVEKKVRSEYVLNNCVPSCHNTRLFITVELLYSNHDNNSRNDQVQRRN